MKRILLLLLLVPLFSTAQKAEIVKLQHIIQLFENRTNKIQVVNFWATWCAPCVKELPIFEKLNDENRPDVKVTLVSMDLDLDSNPEKVYKFISRKNIRSNVLLLDEPNPNEWIDKISPEWSGALPATMIINTETGKRKFIERELQGKELEKIITEIQ
jgi:thiol-disulfide isomerase/thioredoxin